MNTRMPALFIGHGSPMLAIESNPFTPRWHQAAQNMPQPRAIVCISAHWESEDSADTAAAEPGLIYDFYGFPPALYQVQYPVAGSPALAAQLAQVLDDAGLRQDGQRGLDHGTWAVLKHMYPQADVPVVQLAIQPVAGTAWHWRLGQALQPLREEGILIMASGAVTHNFGWLARQGAPVPQAQVFSDWLGEKLAARDVPALLDYRQQAPYGAAAHPTEEHLLPLFVTLGASDADETLTRYTPEYCYGGLAMDAYVWGA